MAMSQETLKEKLLKAVMEDDRATILDLHSMGFDLNTPVYMDQTALARAVINKKVEAVETLLATGTMNLESPAGKLAFAKAANHSSTVDVINAFILAGANINTRFSNDETLLMKACTNANLPVVKELLKAGADVNAQDSYGRTALCNASHLDDVKIVEELLDAGAQETIDVQTKKGDTAVMEAALYGNPSIVYALVEAGANIQIINSEHQTALTYALLADRQGDHQEVVDFLLARGAIPRDVNIGMATKEGKTALADTLRAVKAARDPAVGGAAFPRKSRRRRNRRRSTRRSFRRRH
jgi:ankyrin repeat protein